MICRNVTKPTFALFLLTFTVFAQAPSVSDVRGRGDANICGTTARFLVEFDQSVTGVDPTDLMPVGTSSGPSIQHVGGRALGFQSDPMRVRCDAVSGFPASQLTVELWLKTTDTSGTILSYSQDANGTDQIRLNNPSSLKFRVGSATAVDTAQAVNDGQWHHIAATYDEAATTAQVYIDGVLSGSNTSVAPLTIQDGGGFVLANRRTSSTGFGSPSRVTVDEVRVWDSVRSQADILMTESSPLTGREAGLVLYWDMTSFEDLEVGGNALDIRDLSGRQNHGFGSSGSVPVVVADDPLTDATRVEVVVDLSLATAGTLGIDVLDDGTIMANGLPLTGPFSGGETVSVAALISIASVTPSVVSILGENVTVSGSGFDSVSDVRFGGVSVPYNVLSSTSLTVTIPPCSGTQQESLEIMGCNTEQAVIAYDVNTTLSIDGVEPRLFEHTGGETLTIVGSGFNAPAMPVISVTLGGLPLAFTILDDSTITATTVALPATPNVAYQVEVSDGCAMAQSADLVSHVTVNVPADQPTLAAALALSANNVKVHLAAGEYSVPSSLSASEQIVCIEGDGSSFTRVDFESSGSIEIRDIAAWPRAVQGITFMNGGGNNPTAGAVAISADGEILVRDCAFVNNTQSGLALSGTTNLTLVEDCTFIGNSALNEGGAVYVERRPTTFRSCNFQSNSSPGGGGAVEAAYESVEFEGCTFTGNSAGQGGGAVSAVAGSTARVRSCQFLSNQAVTTGGAIACDGTIDAADTVFVGNMAMEGGGAYAVGSVVAQSCRFDSNVSLASGGGIFGDDLSVTDCEFAGNSAQDSGGAVMLDGGSGFFSACRFLQNSAVNDGGGLRARSDSSVLSCIFQGNSAGQGGGLFRGHVAHSTFEGNQATVGGGADSAASVHGCIFWNNSTDQLANAGTVTDSNIQGGFVGTGVVDVDPLFLDAAGGDLRLDETSPCRDVLAMASTDVDVAGAPRILDGLCDLGAYEYVFRFVGTDEDLALRGTINGGLENSAGVYVATIGDALSVTLLSPKGGLVGASPIVLGQLYASGHRPSPIFPGLVIDPLVAPAPFVILDGSIPGPFGINITIPPGGMTWSSTVPSGLAGSSMVLQGLAVGVPAANGIFVGSDGMEIQFN